MTSNLKKENCVGFFGKNKNTSFFSDEFIARLDEIINFEEVNDFMISSYLERNGSKLLVNDIKTHCDFKKLGFRSIEKYVKRNEKKTNFFVVK